jgi:hypothetical protein
MHDPMWGGLLKDTVSPMGDMVHSFYSYSNDIYTIGKIIK